jgi:hypothetical protein
MNLAMDKTINRGWTTRIALLTDDKDGMRCIIDLGVLWRDIMAR